MSHPTLPSELAQKVPPSQIALLIRDWLAIHERGLGLTLYYGVGINYPRYRC